MAILRMIVEKIEWLSNDHEEARATISDGEYRCRAFCYPCNVKVGDSVNEPLHVFGIGNITVTNETEVGFWSDDSRQLGQVIIAEVTDHRAQMLMVGGISLVIDGYLPGGIDTGDKIHFKCGRVDLL